ncbi:MAG TPA: hypothetical protein VMT89_11135, partial [Candidatus Acidoferrales bacterium]|nr:hypothetical protein [Candidatus Acidoferrales bacterium]
VLLAPVNSSAGLAATLRSVTANGTHIVYETPTEYQYCAAMSFYLQRRVDMLEPSNFIAPTYLQPYVRDLFIDRDQLDQLWHREPVLFVTDPLSQRSKPEEAVPSPHRLVARDYARLVFSNRQLP